MIVYVVGEHGVGKTTFSCKLAPDAEVCFRVPETTGEVYEQLPDIPWTTVRVREGQRVQPPIHWAASNECLVHDFSERGAYRKWAGISPEASVVRVSADYLYAVAFEGMTATQQVETMQALSEILESKFDVVVHETFPLAAPREQDRIVALAVPLLEMRKRQATGQWNERRDMGRAHYIEAARRAVQPEHRYGYGTKSYSRLWWSDGQWRPAEEVASERFEALGNWYHPQILAGIYSPNPAIASYEGRWRALSALFEKNLEGTRVLDIGANTGFNAIRLAERGASVIAIDPDARVIEQFKAVVEMGPFPVTVTDRIKYYNRSAETDDVGELGSFDTVIMSACHYYINRSTREPFKYPAANQLSIPGLRTPLWVVLDAIQKCSARLLIPTNRRHADREKDPYPDAEPDWIKSALESIGYRGIIIHAGYGDTPIVEAFPGRR